ncbi:MAG: TetR/AcrR family transcriptional regulator [Rhodothermia bacterium]|nr:TetR/AcrR family transcriptional regulator [Rhodothermia bacterium]
MPESDTPQKTLDAERDTEEKILEAALQIFSMKGKDGARMHEIADLAGINKALLHYYFRTKDGLYDKVFEYVISKLVRSFGSSLQDAPDFETLLRTFISNYIDFVNGNLAVVRLMVTEHLAGGERATPRIMSMMQSANAPLRLFVDRLREAASRGEIRHVDPYQTLITVVSSCVFFFLVYPTVGALVPLAREQRDQFIEERKQHLSDMLMRSLQPDGESSTHMPPVDP